MINRDDWPYTEKSKLSGMREQLPAGDAHFQRAWLRLSSAVTSAEDSDFAALVIAEVERRAVAVRMGVVPAMESVWDDIVARRIVPPLAR